MTAYAPGNVFVGGPSAPPASAFNENVYEPQTFAIGTLYDYTKVFTSLDMINGWLDYTIYNNTIPTRKLKDRSYTRIFTANQNACIDYKSDNTSNENEWEPIPGLNLTIRLPWFSTVLVHYNFNASNFSIFESGSGVQSILNLKFGFYLNGTAIKACGAVRPGVDVEATAFWGPAYDGIIGKEAFSGSLMLRLPKGTHNIGIYYRTTINLARIHARSIQAVAFRGSIG
mgnify:CR=1 FL=1